MRFADFLKEDVEDKESATRSIGDLKTDIVDLIKTYCKAHDLFPTQDAYVVGYKTDADSVTGKEVIGHFIYKKDIDSEDDSFVSNFIYGLTKSDINIKEDTDEENVFTTIADAEIYIKTKLKAIKL